MLLEPESRGGGLSRGTERGGGASREESRDESREVDEPRSRSLLPAVHVSLLAEDRILPGLAALFDAVGSAIDRRGGSITVHYETQLISAQRIESLTITPP